MEISLRRASDSSTCPLRSDGRSDFWSNVPDELISRIIALLPFSDIHIARGVCRRWRSIALSPSFLSQCPTSFRSRKPWLLEFHNQMYNQAWAFDLDGWKWFHLGLFFLPKNALIVASSKGLVCLGKKSREEYILYVCNPITKMWRQLPALTFDPDIVLLDVDLGTNIYKVAALVLRDNHCSRRPSGTVSVFDSSSNIWVETDEVPVSISSMRVMDASLVGRYLCCLLPDRLVFFDLVERRWIVNNRAHRFVTGDHLDLGYLFVFNRAGKWNVWQHFEGHCTNIHEYNMESQQWRRVSQAETVIAYVGHYSSLTQFGSEEELQGNARHNPKKSGGFSISSTVSDFPKSPLLCDRVKINAGFHIKRLWFKPYIGATP